MVEFRCLLARRRRNHDLNAKAERRAATAFDEDIARGFLELHPLEDRHALDAYDLLMKLRAIPLRTLDALHLAIALALGADTIATADDTFSAAAAALRLNAEWFGRARRDGER